MRERTYLQRGIAAAMLVAVWFANFSLYGQKAAAPSGKTMTSTKPTAKSECKGNYTGVVTYTRTIRMASPGKFGSMYKHEYTYTSNISIRDNGQTQGSMYSDYNGVGGSFNFMGRASATYSEVTDDLKISEGDDFCKLTLKGGQDKRHYRCESRFNRTSNGQGEGDVNVFLGFRGDKYKISLDNPTVFGTSGQSSGSSCSGTCTPDKPINSTTPPSEVKYKPQGTYTDDMPLNPNNLNRISGSFTRPNGNETTTITWNLARCAPPMQIQDLHFEHHRFPDASNWVGVDSLGGTTDGNLVKIKAKVFNNTGETGYATVKFSDVASGEELPDGSVSVAIEAGKTRDVEYEWDTSGYAWDENRKPLSGREIKAEIQGSEAVTEKIKIYPKPIVMAHGLWSNAAAWTEYPNYLREVHSFAWKGYAVGSDPRNGKMNTGDHPGNYKATNTVYQNAQELAKQVKAARVENNAWHLDIVAHSMGGLISRQYINTFMEPVFDGKPAVSHLVMLGTPNMGSPCADTMNAVFEEFDQNEMHAMRELRPIIVRAFNTRVTDKKGVKFSILIGAFMPRTCLDEGRWGDGVVPIESAKYNNTDFAYVFRNHLDLTGREDFDGFVMPRLAIGPKKARGEQAVAENRMNNGTDLAVAVEVYKRTESNFANLFRNASHAPVRVDDENPEPAKLTTKQKVELAANETKTIDIPVEDGTAAGVVLGVPLAVSAVLMDETGAVVGESKGGMPAMKELFRAISVKRPIKKGVWKLKLENLGNVPATAFIGGLTGQTPVSDLVVAAKRGAGETASVTAKWIAGGKPVLNATITANLPNGTAVALLDDGKHGDGASGDSVYGATLTKVGSLDKLVEVKAESQGLERLAVTEIPQAGAAGKPAHSKRRN
jgi:pimeloyl-ACP methyl ester carboxylesterase